MTTILSILDQLSATSKKSEKQEILLQHKDNETFKRVLQYALNPRINFYMKKIPQYVVCGTPTINIDEALSQLDSLSDRKITGNAAKLYTSAMLASLWLDDAEVISRVIKKDLRCGVAASTVNSVFGKNFIPEYPVMLCSPLDEKKLSKISFPARFDMKEDGARCSVQCVDGTIMFFSRQGEIIETHGVFDSIIESALAQYKATLPSQDNGNIVLDGELLIFRDGKFLSRKEGNGYINKAVQGTITIEEASMMRLSLYDIIQHDDFLLGESKVTLRERTAQLQSFVSGLDGQSTVLPCPFDIVSDMDRVHELLEYYWELGLEGGILKDLSEGWKDGRSTKQIKFKKVIECDLEVLDIILGTGKYEGLMGAVTCATADRKLFVNVGSGFTDADRASPPFKVGDIIVVLYNEKISNKKGEHSLFLPIYGKEVRIDKERANTLEEVE